MFIVISYAEKIIFIYTQIFNTGFFNYLEALKYNDFATKPIIKKSNK